jgi:hypothetical protein
MEEFTPVQPEQQYKRPLFLSVLCILTFISTGFSIIGSLIITPNADAMIEIAKSTPQYNAELYDDVFRIWKAGWPFYLIVLIFNLLSLTGAVFMWNLKKIGFHFYTIANIILSYLPVVWFDMPMNIAGLFFPAVFIGMYALHLRFMK